VDKYEVLPAVPLGMLEQQQKYHKVLNFLTASGKQTEKLLWINIHTHMKKDMHIKRIKKNPFVFLYHIQKQLFLN